MYDLGTGRLEREMDRTEIPTMHGDLAEGPRETGGKSPARETEARLTHPKPHASVRTATNPQWRRSKDSVGPRKGGLACGRPAHGRTSLHSDPARPSCGTNGSASQ